MSTTSILHIDPAVNLSAAPAILKDCIAVLDGSKQLMQTRLRSKMSSTAGFHQHIETFFGPLVPFNLTVDTFYNYILNKDMALLKVSFLIQVLSALEGAPEEFLADAYDTAAFAVYTNINVYVRLHRGTELSAVVGYEPPSVLPLIQIADAFVCAFKPILEGRIEETFESFIDDHEYSLANIEKERELLKLIRSDPFSEKTYDKWFHCIINSGYEDLPPRADDPRTDRNYKLIAEACSDEDNYLHLVDLIERRKQSFDDIAKILREFRDLVSTRAKMLVSASTRGQERSKSAPKLLRTLSRKSTTNLLGGQSVEPVQKSIIISYLYFH